MALALVKPNQNPTNNLDEAEYFVKELPLVGYKDDYRLIHKLSAGPAAISTGRANPTPARPAHTHTVTG